MITPPELRRQARRLSIDAEHAADGAEKRILLDLASRLMDTASALERLERSDAPKLMPVCFDFVASAKVVKVPLLQPTGRTVPGFGGSLECLDSNGEPAGAARLSWKTSF
jgi:hypothetical protein